MGLAENAFVGTTTKHVMHTAFLSKLAGFLLIMNNDSLFFFVSLAWCIPGTYSFSGCSVKLPRALQSSKYGILHKVLQKNERNIDWYMFRRMREHLVPLSGKHEARRDVHALLWLQKFATRHFSHPPYTVLSALTVSVVMFAGFRKPFCTRSVLASLSVPGSVVKMFAQLWRIMSAHCNF